jgi:hypothetical protein
MRDADDWSRKVDNIAMEVHSEVGDPLDIVNALARNGFRVLTTDAELRPTQASKAKYIYASATGALKQFS